MRAVGRDRKLNGEERASSDRVLAVLRDTSRASIGGVHERRAAETGFATSADDPADAWPEAALLALPPIPQRSPREGLPHQALGLELPTFDLRTLFQADPKELTQRLPTTRNAE